MSRYKKDYLRKADAHDHVRDFSLRKSFFVLMILAASFFLALFSVHLESRVLFGALSTIVVILISYLFWEFVLIFLYFWLVYSGAIRKWVLPGFSDIIYMFSILILTGVYVRYFIERYKYRDRLLFKHQVNLFLSIFLIWNLICVLNPLQTNIYVGLLGVFTHLYMIPLAYVLPYLLKSVDQLFVYCKLFALLAIPQLILAIVQFFSPLDSPINIYVGGEAGVIENIALVGLFPRITSTFSYLSGFEIYLNVLIFITVFLLSAGNLSKLFNRFLYIVLGLSTVTLFMTGDRSTFFVTVVGVIAYLFVSGVFSLSIIKKSLLNIVISIVITVLFLVATPVGKPAVNAFLYRYKGGQQEMKMRTIRIYSDAFRFMKIAGLYGYGLGSTYQGATAVGHDPTKLMYLFAGGFEEEPERIVVETGGVGFFLLYVLRVVIAYFFWKLYRNLNDGRLKQIALLCLLFQLQFFGLTNLSFNPTNQIIYWIIIGFLFAFPMIDQKIQNTKHAKT